MTDKATIAYRDEIAEQIANLVGARDTYAAFVAFHYEDAPVAYGSLMVNSAISGLMAALATLDRTMEAEAALQPPGLGMFPPLELVHGGG